MIILRWVIIESGPGFSSPESCLSEAALFCGSLRTLCDCVRMCVSLHSSSWWANRFFVHEDLFCCSFLFLYFCDGLAFCVGIDLSVCLYLKNIYIFQLLLLLPSSTHGKVSVDPFLHLHFSHLDSCVQSGLYWEIHHNPVQPYMYINIMYICHIWFASPLVFFIGIFSIAA